MPNDHLNIKRAGAFMSNMQVLDIPNSFLNIKQFLCISIEMNLIFLLELMEVLNSFYPCLVQICEYLKFVRSSGLI